MRFSLPEIAPDLIGQAQRTLAIPCKRADKPLLGLFSRREVEAILATPNLVTWTRRRDHLLFAFLYNTGARISEALQVTPADLQNRVVRLRGKGRKDREVPLWVQVRRELRHWCQDNQIGPSQPIFANRERKCLSRREAARRLALTLQQACMACPSLRNRAVTLHHCEIGVRSKDSRIVSPAAKRVLAPRRSRAASPTAAPCRSRTLIPADPCPCAKNAIRCDAAQAIS